MRQPALIARGLRLRSLPCRLLRFCERPPGSQLPPPSPWAVMRRPLGAKTRRPPLWFVSGWSSARSWRLVLSFTAVWAALAVYRAMRVSPLLFV